MVGGIEQSMESKCYKLPMLDLQGRTFMIEAYSIDKISDNIRSLDDEKIKKIFPDTEIGELKRPSGNHGPTINIRPHIMHFRRLVFSYTE